MKPIKKVIIRDEKYEDGYSELAAKNSEKGDLVIDGCDAGELAKGCWNKKRLGQLGIPSKFSSYLVGEEDSRNPGHFVPFLNYILP